MNLNSRLDTIRTFLFWSWNALFLITSYFGLGPILGSELYAGVEQGSIHLHFFLYFLLLLVLPTASTFLGFSYFLGDSRKLFSLLYCFELPLLAVTTFRLFFMREATFASTAILAAFVFSSAVFGIHLIRTRPLPKYLVFAGATVYLGCGIWAFLLLLPYIPLMAAAAWTVLITIIESFFSVGFKAIAFFLTVSAFFLISAAFFAYTCTLFTMFPIVYVANCLSFWREQVLRSKAYSRPVLKSVALLIAVVFFVAFASRQSHREQLERMTNYVSANKNVAAETPSEEDREGLLEVYLAPYRYLGDEATNCSLQEAYVSTLGWNHESAAFVQSYFNLVALPFTYRGSGKGMQHDQALAEKLYEQIFDVAIHEEERESIKAAMKSTYSRRDSEASLLSINEASVLLVGQKVDLREEGEWAELEIHETYQNRGTRPEEVFIHFKLPKGAVATGVWLSDDTTKKFSFQISPRGAAQKTYKAIIAGLEDPALLEEVGPSLYRLRVFPVPVDRPALAKKNVMHVWLRFRLLKQNEKDWSLPILTEKRNLYWDESTRYVVNGQLQPKGNDWLPRSLPVSHASTAQEFGFELDNISLKAMPTLPFKSPKKCSIAVVIDTSFSLRNQTQRLIELKRTLDQYCRDEGVSYFVWKEGAFVPTSTSHLEEFLVPTSFRGNFSLSDAQDRLDTSAESILFFTDKTFFREVGEPGEDTPLNRPTWFLLVDEQYPRSVSDKFYRQLQKIGGGIEHDLLQVLKEQARLEHMNEHVDILAIDDRYTWSYGKASVRNSDFNSFFAHVFISAAAKNRTQNDLDLDQLHLLARASGIVSPYSSMIVLVNEAQRRLLKQTEERSDRFDRSVETGKEVLTSPRSPFETTAVPEPEEWALLFVVLAILAFHIRKSGWRFQTSLRF